MNFRLLFILLVFSATCFAQDAETLQATGKEFMKQGDYDNAVLVLGKAAIMAPENIEITKDLLFANYLKRDFAKAMEIGKPLVEGPNADVPSIQLMGMVYKAIAEDSEAEKLYKIGLKKFPDEGVLYSEYGDLLAAKNPEGALKLWEKGIEQDPNHSNNYYFVSRQYAEKGDALWSILYGEMFLNMESFTARSTEMKNMLLEQYKKFYSGGVANAVSDKKSAKGFSFAVADVLMNQQSQLSKGITPETLVVIRTRFILDWYNKYSDKYPFRLFDHQRQLLQEGFFEAYNFWLFGPAANLSTYQTWQQYHQEELNSFLGFIRSKVFKVPEGQQYKAM